MNKDPQGIWVGATEWVKPHWPESILQIVDLRPGGFPGSATEQVKVTRLPGHTGGGYVKLLPVVTASVQNRKKSNYMYHTLGRGMSSLVFP